MKIANSSLFINHKFHNNYNYYDELITIIKLLILCIGERRLDPEALLLAVYQDNPGAEFLVTCQHPGGYTNFFQNS